MIVIIYLLGAVLDLHSVSIEIFQLDNLSSVVTNMMQNLLLFCTITLFVNRIMSSNKLMRKSATLRITTTKFWF